MTKLSKNILYSLSGQMILLLISFVAVRFIFRQLGADILGIIYFVAVMNALICTVLEAGICATTVREVAGHYQSEPIYVQHLIRTFFMFFWGLYVLAAIAVFLLAPIIAYRWLQISNVDIKTVVFIIRLLGISALLALPKTFIASLFKGLQRMEINNFLDVVFMSLQQFGVVLILILGGGIFPVIWWYASCYLLWLVAYMLIAVRIFNFAVLLLPKYFHDVFMRNFSFSARMMSISVLTAVHIQADKLIVSKLLPVSLMGYYGFVYAGISRANLITRSVSQAAYPSFSELFKAGKREALAVQYWKLHDMLCLAMVPLFAAFIFVFLPLFSFIFNPIVARELFIPAVFLCIGFYMNGTLNMPYVHSLAVGKPGITVRMNLYAIFAVLPITFFLINMFGLKGAGFSWIFYNIFAYLYGIPRMCRECLLISPRIWFFHVLLIFTLIAITYGAAWFLVSFMKIYSIAGLTIAYLGASLFFIAGGYIVMRHELKDVVDRYLGYSKLFMKFLNGQTSKKTMPCQE